MEFYWREIFMLPIRVLVLIGWLVSFSVLQAEDRGQPWQRHAIDRSSRGADGVRLADVNGDKLLDIATGWEEGGRIQGLSQPRPEESQNRHGPPSPWGKSLRPKMPCSPMWMAMERWMSSAVAKAANARCSSIGLRRTKINI